jgi:hypothetical protein
MQRSAGIPEERPVAAPGAAGSPGVSRDVDRAALLGTALAAVVALTFGGQGAWDWLAAATGIALLTVLAAFFRLPAGTGPTTGVRVELAAVTAVAALAATLVVAPVLQAVIAATTDDGRTCHASAAVTAGAVQGDEARQRGAELAVADGAGGTAAEALERAAADERRTVLGNCLGAVTSRWLWAPAAGMAAVGYALAWWLVRRRHARAALRSSPVTAPSTPATRRPDAPGPARTPGRRRPGR